MPLRVGARAGRFGCVVRGEDLGGVDERDDMWERGSASVRFAYAQKCDSTREREYTILIQEYSVGHLFIGVMKMLTHGTVAWRCENGAVPLAAPALLMRAAATALALAAAATTSSPASAPPMKTCATPAGASPGSWPAPDPPTTAPSARCGTPPGPPSAAARTSPTCRTSARSGSTPTPWTPARYDCVPGPSAVSTKGPVPTGALGTGLYPMFECLKGFPCEFTHTPQIVVESTLF